MSESMHKDETKLTLYNEHDHFLFFYLRVPLLKRRHPICTYRIYFKIKYLIFHPPSLSETSWFLTSDAVTEQVNSTLAYHMMSVSFVLRGVRSGVTPSLFHIQSIQSRTDLHLNLTFSTILLVIHGKMICQCFLVKTSPS